MYLGFGSPPAPSCFGQLLNILPRSRQCTRLAMALALHAAKRHHQNREHLLDFEQAGFEPQKLTNLSCRS
jgi:hypothetical protein